MLGRRTDRPKDGRTEGLIDGFTRPRCLNNNRGASYTTWRPGCRSQAIGQCGRTGLARGCTTPSPISFLILMTATTATTTTMAERRERREHGENVAKTEIDFVFPLAPTLRPPARLPNDIAHSMRSDHALTGDDEDHDRDRDLRTHGRSVRPQFHQDVTCTSPFWNRPCAEKL